MDDNVVDLDVRGYTTNLYPAKINKTQWWLLLKHAEPERARGKRNTYHFTSQCRKRTNYTAEKRLWKHVIWKDRPQSIIKTLEKDTMVCGRYIRVICIKQFVSYVYSLHVYTHRNIHEAHLYTPSLTLCDLGPLAAMGMSLPLWSPFWGPLWDFSGLYPGPPGTLIWSLDLTHAGPSSCLIEEILCVMEPSSTKVTYSCMMGTWCTKYEPMHAVITVYCACLIGCACVIE